MIGIERYSYEYCKGCTNAFLRLKDIKAILRDKLKHDETNFLFRDNNGRFYIKRYSAYTDRVWHLYYSSGDFKIYKIEEIKRLY